MGGSPDNNANTPLRTGGEQGAGVQFVPQQKWNIESTHPEALWSGIASGVTSLGTAGLGAMGKAAAYHGQFGKDQMSSQGFYESMDAAKKAGIQNPQMWKQGTGEYGVEGTGWY